MVHYNQQERNNLPEPTKKAADRQWPITGYKQLSIDTSAGREPINYMQLGIRVYTLNYARS